MIFHEWYGRYYRTVEEIIRAACDHPVDDREMVQIIQTYAFAESVMHIQPAFQQGRWNFLRQDGTTSFSHLSDIPLTTLEKQWINAVGSDVRMRLFTDEWPFYPEVEPLFTGKEIVYYDRAIDGDPFTQETYVRHFRLILYALRNKVVMRIRYRGQGKRRNMVVLPKQLEYSEKDDKFRLLAVHQNKEMILNLARMEECTLMRDVSVDSFVVKKEEKKASVTFTLVDERMALERVLMHFAHFEKEVERMEEDRYRVVVTYDKRDEAEMMMRILSFGPMVVVTQPASFVKGIKDRLLQQIKWNGEE